MKRVKSMLKQEWLCYCYQGDRAALFSLGTKDIGDYVLRRPSVSPPVLKGSFYNVGDVL